MKIVIIGAGEVGFHIAEKLVGENIDVVVVENDLARLHQIEEHLDAKFVQGSGSSPDVLRKAGISAAEMVIAVSDKDEANIVACLVANHYSSSSIKIARVRDPAYLNSPDVFEDLSIDLFINPEFEAAEKFVKLLEVPQALDLIEFAEGKVQLVGFRIDEKSLLANRKLFAFGDVVPGYIPLVAAIYRGSEVIVPSGADTVRAGDIVYFTTTPDKMEKLLKLVGKKMLPIERVMIFGGTNTGLYLAKKLEERGVTVRLIEPDEKRCTELADQLTRTTVLHGDAKDSEMLLQENIDKMDVYIALSKDAEDNILSCLLAKSLGTKITMTLSNRIDYSSLISTIGIDSAVSPQLAAVSRIMRFVRQGRIASVEAIREKDVEGIEFVALESSEAVNKPLKKIKFPRGALVMAVVRGEEVVIPTGETMLQPEDRVIIFAKRQAISKIEKMFAVKLEYF